MKAFRFHFPEIPVSVNRLYRPVGGRKVLTTEGLAFKNRFVAYQGGRPELLEFEADPEMPYKLTLQFTLSFDRLVNLNYGHKGNVKYLFTNFDVSNLIKVAEDGVAQLLGLNDRSNWDHHVSKRIAVGNIPEMMEGTLEPLEGLARAINEEREKRRAAAEITRQLEKTSGKGRR